MLRQLSYLILLLTVLKKLQLSLEVLRIAVKSRYHSIILIHFENTNLKYFSEY